MVSCVCDAGTGVPMNWGDKDTGNVLCGRQVSLRAKTILHNTKTPLTAWFWAAYLMTTDKRGVSALLLQRQLGLQRYETAWMMLHKFRRAMVNLARDPLRSEVEVDETWVGGTQAGLRGGRQLKGRKRHWSLWLWRNAAALRDASLWRSYRISKAQL